MTQSQQESKSSTNDRSAKARVKYLRIAPRKVRPVINAIRHEHPGKAFHILATLNKKAARMVEKLLKTGVANAKVLGLDESRLTISDIRADGGPMMKRFMARSMGRADRILKRMTHLSLVLTEGSRSFSTTEKTVKDKKAMAAKAS